jgi:hypothetical protein
MRFSLCGPVATRFHEWNWLGTTKSAAQFSQTEQFSGMVGEDRRWKDRWRRKTCIPLWYLMWMISHGGHPASRGARLATSLCQVSGRPVLLQLPRAQSVATPVLGGWQCVAHVHPWPQSTVQQLRSPQALRTIRSHLPLLQRAGRPCAPNAIPPPLRERASPQ